MTHAGEPQKPAKETVKADGAPTTTQEPPPAEKSPRMIAAAKRKKGSQQEPTGVCYAMFGCTCTCTVVEDWPVESYT